MTRKAKRFGGFWLLGLCMVLALTLSAPQQAFGQALYGTLTGQVRDATGGAIPGAEVTILNLATNFTQTGITNDIGNYTLRNVPVGMYRVSVTLTGFREAVLERVNITAGVVTRENVTLQIGELTESITVSGAATLLRTDTAELSSQLDTKEIADLPLNVYRNYQALINLVPGATPAGFQNAITDTPGRALTTNIQGTARNVNMTRIDGAQSVNLWLPHHTAYVPPSETIEVVDISTNTFDAEKGFAGGAAVTVITKSGTNDFRGSAFWYHENSALNARNFFNYLDRDGDGKADKPVSRRNIGGFTIGGPIVKDKLFFFGGWEGTFHRVARQTSATVATAAMRAGNFSAWLPDAQGSCPGPGPCSVIYDPLTGTPNGDGKTPFPGNIIPADRISPAASAMQALIPLPNLSGRLTQNYEIAGTEAMDRHNYDVKVDWYRSDTHRLWGKFSYMDAEVAKDTVFGPGGGGAIGGGGDGVGATDVKVYSLGHNWTISPTFLMDANFGYTDMDQIVETADLALGNFGQSVLGIPGVNAAAGQDQACIVDGLNRCGGIPFFGVSGFSTMGQTDGWSPLWRDENSATFTQNFSISTGNHELRFGYDLVKHMMGHWQPEIGSGPRGGFSFSQNLTANKGGAPGTERNSYAAFLLGIPSSAGKSLQWEFMTANEWQHAWYLRDRWQLSPKLTLTLGLRYEFFPLITRDDRPMEILNLRAGPSACQYEQGGVLRTGECLYMTLDNDVSVSKSMFAPRLGFAYRLSDDDVFRAGYGLTNSPLPFARPLRGFYPLTVGATFPTQDSFVAERSLSEGIPLFIGPQTAPGSVIPLPPFIEQRTMPEDKINRGYIQTWNVMYERKLPADFVTSVGYAGTQTTRQLADHYINWALPGTGVAGRQYYPYNTSNIMFWDGWLSSNYHSLQISVNRRFTDGLFVKGAYTWGRAINRTDDEGWAGVSWNDPKLLHRNRAQAGYNRPQNLQLAAVYELPWGRGRDDFAGMVLRGWQVNGVFSAHDQAPFTVSSGGPLNAPHNTQTADQVKSDVANLGGIRDTPYYDPTAFAQVTRIPGTQCNPNDESCYGSAGRNILRGPSWVNLDFSLFRTFFLTEGVGLEFRAEAFNLSNTPKFNNPNGSSAASNFMHITSTSANAPERILRFGFKLSF
jgi:hypothetical protein